MSNYLTRALAIIERDGFGQLAWRIIDRLTLPFEKQQTATSVTHKQAMRWFRRQQGAYNLLISSVLPYLEKDAVIFDVGANIGYFTWLLSQKTSLKAAYLFEPVPHLVELCKSTLKDANYDVTILDFGLSDEDTEVEIYMAGNGNIGWNTVIPPKTTADKSKQVIPLKEFDNCGIDITPTLIKVDVEGAEHLVLRGMRKSLERWHPLPVILCEVLDYAAVSNWDQKLQMISEMKALGYKLCNLDGTPLDESHMGKISDILFLPIKS